jgi:predicted ATPase
MAVSVRWIHGRRCAIRYPPDLNYVAQTVWFRFADLCQAALGAGDYIALVYAFDTFFLADIPRLDTDRMRNEQRRFITLVDILYEAHARLYASMAAPPAELGHRPTAQPAVRRAWPKVALPVHH